MTNRFAAFTAVSAPVCLLVAALSSVGAAGSETGVNRGLSMPSNGTIPSMMEHLQAQEPKVQSMSALGQVGPSGDVGWSTSVETVPAMMKPSVSLSWSSSGGPVGWVAPGWSLEAGPRITELGRAARVGAYQAVEADIVQIGGGGLSGLLVSRATSESVSLLPGASGFPWSFTGSRYELEAHDGSYAVAWWISDRNAWVLRAGTTSTVYLVDGVAWDGSGDPADLDGSSGGTSGAPRASLDNATAWSVVYSFDTSGNEMGWVRGDYGRLERIVFGGRNDGSQSVAPVGTVEFAYEPALYVATQVTHGVPVVYGSRLAAIHSCSRVQPGQDAECGTGLVMSSLTLTRATLEQRDQIVAIDRLGSWSSGLRAVMPVASFEYTDSGDASPRLEADSTEGGMVAALGASITISRQDMLTTSPRDTLDIGVHGTELGYGNEPLYAALGGSQTFNAWAFMDANGDGLSDVVGGSANTSVTCPSGGYEVSVGYVQQGADGRFHTGEGRESYVDCQEVLLYNPVDSDNDHEIGEYISDGTGSGGIRQTVDLAAGITATFTRRAFMDLNGDGYLDIVESGDALTPMEPDEGNCTNAINDLQCKWIGAVTPGVLESNTNEAASAHFGTYREYDSGSLMPDHTGFVWHVRFGDASGEMSERQEILAPFPYQGVSVNDAHCDPYVEHFDHFPSHTNEFDRRTVVGSAGYAPVLSMMDVNGDRLLDLLYVGTADWLVTQQDGTFFTNLDVEHFTPPHGSDVHVYLQRPVPERPTWSASWGANPPPAQWFTPAQSIGSGSVENLIAAEWTMNLVEGEWLKERVVDAPDQYDMEVRETMTCANAYIDRVRGFEDLNGDGWIDFVNTLTTNDESWDVYFGGPGGLWQEAVPWPVPSLTQSPDRMDEDSTSSDPTRRRYTPMERTFEGYQPIYNTPFPAVSPFVYDDGEHIALTPHLNNPMYQIYLTDLVNQQSASAGIIDEDVDEHADPSTANANRGNAWRVVGLLDVDGDGLPDFVESHSADAYRDMNDEVHWYRSYGGGFLADDACSAPAGLADCSDEMLTGGLDRTYRVTNLEKYNGASYTISHDVKVVRDLNADGALDMVRFGHFDSYTNQPVNITYGAYPRAGMLHRVNNLAGAVTDYVYQPGSLVEPAGEVGVAQRGNQRRDLVSAVISRDLVTGHVAGTRWTFAHPVCGGGTCPGFESVTSTQWEWRTNQMGGGAFSYWDETCAGSPLQTCGIAGAPASWTSFLLPPSTPEDSGTWRFLSMTQTENQVLREGPVAVRTDFWTDVALQGVPGFDDGTATVTPMLQRRVDRWSCDVAASAGSNACDFDYTMHNMPNSAAPSNRCDDGSDLWDLGQAGATEDPTVSRCRTAIRRITTWGEDPQLPAVEARFAYEWNADGLMTSSTQLDPGDPAGAGEIQVESDYTWDAAHSFALPRARRTYGRTVQSDMPTLLESLSYAYDDPQAEPGSLTAPTRGLLVTQKACAGTRGIGSACETSLMWTFEWTDDEGALSKVDGPKGSYKLVPDLAFAFGGAVPLIEENKLGHAVEREVDAFGRVVVEVDPNGVERHTEYDGFGRPVRSGFCGVRETTTGSGPPCPLWTEQKTYVDDEIPRAVSTQTLQPVPGSNGEVTYAVESTGWSVVDGHGKPRQSWTTRADGEFTVVDTLHDVFGNQRYSTWPHREASYAGGMTALLATTAEEVQGEAWFDGFGALRASFADRQARPECMTRVEYARAGAQVTLDESGRAKMFVHDAFGRLVEVREDAAVEPDPGEPCVSVGGFEPQTVTGRYGWDGMSRLSFLSVPGEANDWSTWLYDYDAAGRMTTVRREHGVSYPDWEDADPYYAYRFDGAFPSEMFEGEADAGTPEVTWTYDALGRVLERQVIRATCEFGAEPDIDLYTWTWDTRWIGAKSTATSPFETTEWYFNDPVDLEPWGKVGLVQATERDFGAAWGEPVRFEYRYDVQGRTLGTRFPSGTQLWQMTSHGVPDVAYVVRNGMQSTIEAYQFAYDDFGMVAGWGQVAPAWSGSAPAPDHPHDFEFVRSSPTTLDATVWNSPAGPSYGVDFAQGADGRLVSKLFDLGAVIEADLGLHGMDYGYDALGRVALAETRFWGLDSQSGQPVEERVVSSAYGYDTMGNVQALEQRLLQQDGSVFDVALDYDPTGPFAQLGRRFVPMGPPGPGGQPLMLENGFHHDDVTGRVIGSYMAMMPGTEETQATVTGYFYDGTGKLACVDGYELQGDLGTSPGLSSPGLESADPPDPEPDFQASKWLDLRYHYDLHDELVARQRLDTDGWVLGNNYTGQVGETELWFQGWQLDFVATSEGYTPRVVERVLPWLDVLSDELGLQRDAVLLFREPDGHVLLQLDEVGDVEGVDVLGPYGLAAGRMAYGTGGNPDPGPGQGGFDRDVRDLHQLHGMQLDREADLTRMGVRHVMMTGDGRWLQPEPLLHLGPGDAQLGSPRAMFGAYAMGVPTHLQDKSGYQAQPLEDEKQKAASDEGIELAWATDTIFGWWRQESEEVPQEGVQKWVVESTQIVAGATPADVSAMQGAEGAFQWLMAAASIIGFPSLPGACFVAGTEVTTPSGGVAIESLAPGMLVLSATEPEAESLDVRVARRPAASTRMDGRARLCQALRRWGLSALVSMSAPGWCEGGSPPSAGASVLVYGPGRGVWQASLLGEVEVGSEVVHADRLYRVTASGLVYLAPVTLEALAAADAAVTEVEAETEPTGDAWVLVLASEGTPVAHRRLSEVSAGARFAFQGRVYEARSGGVEETGEVLGRVVDTFVRPAGAMVDMAIGYPDGTTDRVTGTPNHPFWVPSVQDYVALEDLTVGTVLRTYGGAEATVLGLTSKHGAVEVFNLEVEGVHNYFVQGSESDALGVLVHNGCGDLDPKDFAGKKPSQIDALAKEKGLVPKGPDPQNGRGAYVDRDTNTQRVLCHGCDDNPHMHVNNAAGERLDIDGNVVPAESPAAHLPIGSD